MAGSTSTSAFGVSKRESHDASGFYRRFNAPDVATDSEVATDRAVAKLIVGDARHMDEIPDASVALVVTSPPYFAGKEYEEALGHNGVPATYLEYLDMLRDVFAECVRKLEPGGRIAVNVANLGRRPYRSLSADVIAILQDDLRLLLRGEIIWVKQKGAGGSCAWGSFQRAANPVLRDLTERIIVAGKGRFDRARAPKDRVRHHLPHQSTMTRDDFMENTLDLWEIPAESATRVGHPAPFPVELPSRLIELYTYRDDLVLDPFAGSGSTAVAAIRTGRHFVGYDLDPAYIRLAEGRLEEERQHVAPTVDLARSAAPRAVPTAAAASTPFEATSTVAHAVSEGKAAKDIALAALQEAGFQHITKDPRLPGGVAPNFSARAMDGRLWLFDVVGPFTAHRGGLARSDALWRALGRAAVLREVTPAPLVWLTTQIPDRGKGADTLKHVTGEDRLVHTVIDVLSSTGRELLASLGTNGTDASGTNNRPRARISSTSS